MILIDSDIFILDNFYKNDPRYEPNNLFLHRVQNTKKCTTIFNLLEVCSLIAPHCGEDELLGFFENFDRTYNIDIVYPLHYDLSTEYFLDHFFSQVLLTMQYTGNVTEGMMFTTARQRDIRVVISWNAKRYKKNFGSLEKMEYMTPDEYMRFYKSFEKKSTLNND
jgi:hypothetical protein